MSLNHRVYVHSRSKTPPGIFRPAASYRLGFLSRHTSSQRGCPIKFDGVSSSSLIFSTANRLLCIAALKSRFTNSLRALPLPELTDATSPRTRALWANTVSSSSRRASIFSRLPHLFLFFFLFDARWSMKSVFCTDFSGTRR